MNVLSKSALTMQNFWNINKSISLSLNPGFLYAVASGKIGLIVFSFLFFFKPSAVTFKNLTLILSAMEIITHSQLLSLEPVNECYIINRSRAAG